MKKMFSLIAAIALVITMIPFQSTFAEEVNTKVKAEKKVWVGNLDAQHGALISLEESKNDSWKTGDKIVIKLPNGMNWHKYTRINGKAINLSAVEGRNLTVNVTESSDISNIIVDPFFNIDRSVEKGDVIVAVSGNRIAVDNGRLTIAEVKEYGAKLSASNIEDFNYGQYKSKEVIVTLEEFVQGSLLNDVEYELIIENATLDSNKEILSRIKQGSRRLTAEAVETNVIKLTADENATKGKWDIVLNIIPNKDFDGDINVRLEGRGVEDTITIARVNKDLVTLNSTPTNIALGYQDQPIASIDMTETSPGAIMKGSHAIAISPLYQGMNITSGKIEVLEGNIEIGNFSYDNGMIKFDVLNSSTRASKIVINDLKVTIDEFGFLGNYTGQLLFDYGKTNEALVEEFILFNATTGKPVDQAAKFVGQFTIGNPNFTIITNGISRTEAFDSAPYIQDSRTMLSVAAAGVALDAKVRYEGETKTVTVESDGKTAVLKIGSNILMVDGQEVAMDTEATITNSRTFIPLKYLADVFGAETVWDQNTKTVSLIKN